MLIKSKSNIYNFVYYQAPVSILLIQYRVQNKRVYFYINPDFFASHILPLIKQDRDFRAPLHWAANNNLATEIDQYDPRVAEVDDKFLKVVK